MINLSGKSGLKKMLSLAYYSNNIGMYFYMESIVTHATVILQMEGEVITTEKIFKKSKFVWSIFKNEFMPRESNEAEFDENMREIIQDSIRMNLINYDE